MTVYLAQSIWRQVEIENAESVKNALYGQPEDVWHELQWGDALIARSRSILATKFLKEERGKECDVMVFVDGDITFEVDDFVKVVEGARETRSIYGGLYVTRSTTPHLASRPLEAQEWEFHRSPERRPREVQYLATGFMAIHRDVIEAMVGASFLDIDGGHELHEYTLGVGDYPTIDFFSTFGVWEERDGEQAAHWLSEDWAFCERARQLGFKIWADQSVILGHKATVTLTVQDLVEQGHALSSKGIPSSGATTVRAGNTIRETGDPLIDTLPADIAEWSGEDVETVRRMLPLGAKYMAEAWNQWEGTEREFYRSEIAGKAYMVDLAAWHMVGAAKFHYEGAKAGRPDDRCRILDYGAGIGTHALMLARDGHHVAAVEPNPVLREFILWRAAKHGLTVWVNSDDQSLEANYDQVIATHVFEHMADYEVASALSTLALVSDTLFIENDWTCDENHPMHHDWESNFRSWTDRLGLVADEHDGRIYRAAVLSREVATG